MNPRRSSVGQAGPKRRRSNTRRWALVLSLAAMVLAELNLACGAAGAARAASGGARGCSKAASAGAAGKAAANAERAVGASAAEAAAARHADDAVPRRAVVPPKDEPLPPATTGAGDDVAQGAAEHGPLREHGSEAAETAVDVGSNAVDLSGDAEED